MRHCALHRIAGIFIFLGVVALATAVVMWLWNALVPAIFGLTAITFWQTLGLMILTRLLFGGVGDGFRHCHNHWHRRRAGRPSGPDHWDHMHQIRNRMKEMSRSERKEFIRNHMTRFADEAKEWHGARNDETSTESEA